MRVVLGIGNPGARYAKTRHNVGFHVVDAVARRGGASFRKASRLHMEARLPGGGRLVKPLTYVNRSGQALSRCCEHHEAGPGELLVVVDDVNLEPGRLRLKAKGSHGGHNGLKDIERAWGSPHYARLRIGVGATTGEPDLVEHVLGPFADAEVPIIGAAVERAARVVEEFLAGAGLDRLMGTYNRSPAGEQPADG